MLEPNPRYRHIFIPELGREVRVWKDVAAFWKVWKILKTEKPDILHTHTSKAGIIGRLAAICSRVPVRVHTFHGHVFEGYYGRLVSSLIRMVEKILGYFTTRIIAISQKQKEDLVTKYRIAPAHKISVVPLGFDLKKFEGNGVSKMDIKHKLNLPASKFCVGIIGRLAPIKNHQLFLRVIKRILKKRDDVHFLIVGNGSCYAALYEIAKFENLLPNLSFLSWQKDLKPIYEILDVICLTSFNEGTPVSLIEAQACGVPIVSTRVGGTPDIVFSGKNGYLLSPDDEAGFETHILKLLDNSELRQRMSVFGRNYALNNFDKGRLLMDIDNLYLELLRIPTI